MLKYNLKDLTKAYENGIVNKAYQGLTKNGYQWVDVDSRESTTLQEQMSCRGLRFSVDDYMNVERKPVWHIGEICEIDGQRKYGNFRIENDELVLILDRDWDEYCGEDEEGNPIYIELGRWHRGETVELRSDTLTVNWIIDDDRMYSIPWQCYIDRKGVGRVVYQRIVTPEPPEPPVETKNYFRFKAIDTGTFQMTQGIQYSLDSGTTWVLLSPNTNSPTIQAGDYIYWKRDTFGGKGPIGTFSSTGRFDAMGNILSLVVADDFEDGDAYKTSRNFYSLLKGCTGLKSAENVIFPTTVITMDEDYNGCYQGMFSGCTAMTIAPKVLPATTLKHGCYREMFNHCNALVQAPEIKATTVADYSCYYMFNYCRNLRESPVLSAATLAEQCYGGMFLDCVRLTSVTCLATNISATNCTNVWLRYVADTGTLYTKASTNWSSGYSGIPSGWARVNI